jgi:predicted Zn-dependent protease
MASKVNKKFVLVVAGFVAAAALLLAAIIVVNVTYLQNADRHIRSGDELMAQGKVREAYNMYGRAVNKKPNEIRYIEKMEAALDKTVATNAGQALEDYRSFMGLKRARTRAQPGDVAQWQALFEAMEAESQLYDRGDGWLNLETAAKEMKDAVGTGSPAARVAEEWALFAREQREEVLTPAERAELDKGLEAYVKQDPKSWRAWSALVDLRVEDVARLRGTGQQQASVRRLEQLDRAIADMRKALDGSDGMGSYALARAALDRARLDARTGSKSIDRSKLDMQSMKPLIAALASAAGKSGSGRAVRETSALLLDMDQGDQESELIDGWIKSHPDDLLTQAYRLEARSRMAAADPMVFETLRADAQALVDRPQLPTGLMSNLQSGLRARALQLLIDTAAEQVVRDPKAPAAAKLMEQLPGLRAKLVESEQNDEAAPRVLAADAKIALAKEDLPTSAAKWEQFFTKVPSPAADAFFWASTTARRQGDLGLALQRAAKGSDANPNDLRLALQRAEITALLGRFAEAAALYEAISKAIPDNKDLANLAAEVKARARPGGAQVESAEELRGLQAAAEAKDWPKARALAAQWVAKSSGSLAALYAQAMLEMQAGDKAKALQFAQAGYKSFPGNLDLARVEAMATTDDPIERIRMVIDRVVADPKQRPAEMLRAMRGVRDDQQRQLAQSRVANPTAVKDLEQQVARLDERIAAIEKQVAAATPDDPSVIETTFNEALARRDFAAAEAQLAAASKQKSVVELELVLRARLLEVQDKRAEAIAMLEKARAQGRNEAAITSTLGSLQEAAGNEPAAFALWKDAYDRRPNDPAIARGYARAMARAGQGRNALEMVRAAANANPTDPAMQSQAAQFEALYGSKTRAAQLRLQIMRTSPGDRQNVADLYDLLYSPPEPAAVVDANGRPRYEARDWAAVPIDERRRLLDDASNRAHAQAEAIYEAAVKAAPLDMLMPVTKARVMRGQGSPEQGTAALQDLVKRAEAQQALTTAILLEVAAHQLASGDNAGLDATIARALPMQDPVKREVSNALVEIEARRGRMDQAIEALAKSLGDTPSVDGLLRLGDLQIVAGREDDAEKTIERLRTVVGPSPAPSVQRGIEMLVAGVATSRAGSAGRKGEKEVAKAEAAKALEALGRAAALIPTDYIAPLRRVQLMASLAITAGDPVQLDAAIAEADRLLARNSMIWEVVSARADLSLERRDIQGAIGVLEKFIQAQPSSDQGRARLVDMFAQVGNYSRALEVCRAGAELYPQNPAWAERLGELLGKSGDWVAASKEFDRALQIQPDRQPLLAKAIDARLNAGQSAEALDLLRSRNAVVTKSPPLRAFAAVSLWKAGRREEAAVAAREAITAAHADPNDAPTQERTLGILRGMFGAARVADFEALVMQAGTPTPMECIVLSEEWASTGPGGVDKSLAWSSKVLDQGDKIDPVLRAGALMSRGNSLFAKGDAAGAIDAFTGSSALSPRNAGAANNSAYLLSKVKGDHAGALEYARRAVMLEPGNPDFLDTLGYVEFRLGKLPEAEDTLSKSVAVAPTASGLLHLAQVKSARGKAADASALLDRARAKATTDEQKQEIEEAAKALSSSK